MLSNVCCALFFTNSAFILGSSPIKTTEQSAASNSFANKAPLTVAVGAKSPPTRNSTLAKKIQLDK